MTPTPSIRSFLTRRSPRRVSGRPEDVVRPGGAAAALAAAAVLGVAVQAGASEPPHVERDADGRVTRLPAGGMGLDGPTYWSTAWPFVNAMKLGHVAGRPEQEGKTFIGSWKPGDAKLPLPRLGRDGYPAEALTPGQSLQASVFTHNDMHYPAGTWVLAWDGTGELELKHPGVADNRSDSGRIEVELTEGEQSPAGFYVIIHQTDPADPVRNLRLWMPGFENADSPFHPLYKERLGEVGVLRRMDWGATNGSTVANWDQRTRPTGASYSGPVNAVPDEMIVQLGNETQKDIWITVPHLTVDGDLDTRDEYVVKLAHLIRYGSDAEGEPYTSEQADPVHPPLDEDLKVWLEYSNEVWNWQFAQTHYAKTKMEEWGVKHPKAAAQLSQDMAITFKEAFGDDDRVLHVIASQAANPWQLKMRLEALPPAGEPGAADLAAIAHYFTPNEITQSVNRTLHEDGGSFDEASLTEFFRMLNSSIDGETYDWWSENAELARAYGVPLVSYEGNQHMTVKQGAVNKQQAERVGIAEMKPHEKLEETLHAITRDPRMYEAYQHALDTWVKAGGTTATAFVNVSKWSQHGQWGHLEYQDQPVEEAPLHRAFYDWIAEHADGFSFDTGAASGSGEGRRPSKAATPAEPQ